MTDYKELYLKMLCASEQAITLLIAAQRECEERYIDMAESNITLLPDLSKGESE